MLSARDHLRAASLLAIYAVVFILSTPGMESLKLNMLRTDKQIAEAKESFPALAVNIAWFFLEANREIRMPMVRFLTPLQRPLRLEQTWTLYGDGPKKPGWIEIWADDEVLYRSASWEHTWMRRQLRHRRIRPMVDTSTMKIEAPNRPGLSRMILHHVRAARPDAQTIELRYIHGRYPTGAPQTVAFLERASAPEWTLELREP